LDGSTIYDTVAQEWRIRAPVTPMEKMRTSGEIVVHKRDVTHMPVDQTPGEQQCRTTDQSGGGQVHARHPDLEHAVGPIEKSDNFGHGIEEEAHVPDHHDQEGIMKMIPNIVSK